MLNTFSGFRLIFSSKITFSLKYKHLPPTLITFLFPHNIHANKFPAKVKACLNRLCLFV